MADERFVTVERVEGVGRIVMDRPSTHNAMHEQMATELRDATSELAADGDIRCIVLTGVGDAFNTGADLSVLDGTTEDASRLQAIATRLHTAIAHLAGAPKPAVTGLNGIAAGGGFGLALAGDVVVAHEDARLEYAYPAIGLSGDGGATYFLPRLVGHRRAREIALLDEPIPAEGAVDMGLATEVVEADRFEDRLATLSANLAAGPTRAQADVKRLLNRSYARDLRAQMAAEADSMVRLVRTADYARGIEAFGTDESADFEGE